MVTSATNAAALVQAPGAVVATGIGVVAVGVAAAGVLPATTVGARVAVAGKVAVIMGVVAAAVVGTTTIDVAGLSGLLPEGVQATRATSKNNNIRVKMDFCFMICSFVMGKSGKQTALTVAPSFCRTLIS